MQLKKLNGPRESVKSQLKSNINQRQISATEVTKAVSFIAKVII